MIKRVVVVVISVGYFGLAACHRLLAKMLGLAVRETRVVLTYHGVEDHETPRFDSQMLKLTRSTRPVFADAPFANEGGRSVAVTFDDAFQHVFDRVLPVLKERGIPATVFVPTGYLGTQATWPSADGRPNSSRDRVAGRETLASVDARYVRLGSHSVTHPKLATTRGPDLDREFAASKLTLESVTGSTISMFALPYGSFTSDTIAAASRAGYAQVFANVPVRLSIFGSVALLGRVNVTPADWPIEFHLKIHGAYDWLAFATPVKRAVVGFLGRRLRDSRMEATSH